MKNNESWYRMPLEVMKDERLNGLSMSVYAIMLDRAKGNEVRITAKKIAELLEKQQRNVQRAIRQLKDTGYIIEVKRGQSGNTVYTIKKVLPEKKRRPEQEQFEIPQFETTSEQEQALKEQLTSKPKVHTFETDFTPTQVRVLSEMLAEKLPIYDRTPKRIETMLRGMYDRMRLFSKGEIKDVMAYMKTMIDNMEEEPEPKRKRKKRYDDDFDVEAYERICINNYEVI